MRRVIGVDVARGVALIGMMAAHVFNDYNGDGSPTETTVLEAGRSAATFALLAGLSMTFIDRAQHSTGRRSITVYIAVRATLIGTIGLALNYVPSSIDVILPYCVVFFILAIPLLRLSPRAQVGLVAAVITVVPVVLLATFRTDLTSPALTFGGLLHHPFGVAVEILLTGSYPALGYMAFVCAGIAIGRLNLSSARVASRLLGGGLALSLGAWLLSSVLLFHLGGLNHLRDAAAAATGNPVSTSGIMWNPDQTSSWWWIAVPAPHAMTPIDLLLRLGAAVAVLGAGLLLTHVRIPTRILNPVAIAGSMTLTLYTAQVLVLATGLLRDHQLALYLTIVAASLTFASVWHRWVGQGPLERITARLSGAASSRSTKLTPTNPCSGRPTSTSVPENVFEIAHRAVVPGLPGHFGRQSVSGQS